MKVVCIANPKSRSEGTIGRPQPNVGDVLTINYIENDSDGVYLGFKEMHTDSAFISRLFRPIKTTYTESEIESVDISEITQEEVITV